MELSAALLGILFSSMAFASPQTSKLPPPPTYKKATANISIFRSKIVKKGDNYVQVRENICQKSVPFDVLDLRDLTSSTEWAIPYIECETKSDGKEIKAYVSFQALVGNTDNTGAPADTLFTFSSGFTLITGGTRLDQFPATVQSRDLKVNSLISTLGEQLYLCKEQNSQTSSPCNPGSDATGKTEVLNAEVEYIGQ